MRPYHSERGIEIYHGDCREILPDLRKGVRIDAVVSDPPYGIDLDGPGCNTHNKNRAIVGDGEPFEPAFLFGIGTLVLWGGNNFADQLPIGGWLCWDKRVVESADVIRGSPFELAWVNDRSKFKLYRLQHCGAINADAANTPRWHPTQKPVRLMTSVLRDFPADLLCDPFMGSGSTLLGAKLLGRAAIGIEIEEKYCEIAAKRLSQEVFQF